MSELIERLRREGADIAGAMSRMVDDEELYATCFAYFIDDPSFDALRQALEEKDYTAAFDAAHTLKGVAGNLGLTRMYELAGGLVEPLRHGQPGDADLVGMYQAVAAEREKLKEIGAG